MGLASAATTSSTNGQSIVEKIACKFNLNKDEVQKVFDENRAAHEAERTVEVKTQLDHLVKDGKITQDQEDKLIAKGKELQTLAQANRDSFKDKTKAERKTARSSERAAFTKWLSDNGISEEYGRLILGRHSGHNGHGGPPPTSTIN